MRKLLKMRYEIKQFMKEQSGSLDQALWLLGAAVIVIAVILTIKAIAPNTATELWNGIIDFTKAQFGF